MFKTLLLVLLSALALPAAAQTNVRAWNAAGQTFVVWETAAVDPLTYDVYRSPVPLGSVAGLEPVGRLLREEWGAARLRRLVPGAHWRVPGPMGGVYPLAQNEGVFAYTPHAASSDYFIVVAHGQTAVGPGNITAQAVIQGYDPVGDPVRAHLQLALISPQGYPLKVWAVWVDGRADHAGGRPDLPVMANAAKNGVGHVFYVSEPQAGLPPGPYPAALALHGGGGEYENFRPGAPSHLPMQLELEEGVVLTPDNSIFYRDSGQTVRTGSRWFGYVEDFDPFTDAPRTNPPDGTLIVDYTSRLFHWILDRLLDTSPRGLGYHVDPARVSMVGHSGGGNGTGIQGRLHPERFSALVMYTPGVGLDPQADMCCFPLGGSHAQNLPTSVLGPGGTPLGFTELLVVHNRLSASERDSPLLRIFSGRADTVGGATWSPLLTDHLEAIDAAGVGAMLFWDQRRHGVHLWPQPPAVGQWVAPVNTERASLQYLTRYRRDRSYPGFFGVDMAPQESGRQPELGNGDPFDGDAWGTWGGYLDWDLETIADTPEEWAATLWLVGLSSVAVDNCPVEDVSASLAIRRPQQFLPAEGQPLAYELARLADGTVLQAGHTTAGGEGLVAIHGLTLLRDPERLRLTVRPVPYAPYCAGDGSAAACPCGNAGAADRGCGNGASPSGAALVAEGLASASASTLTLRARDLAPGAPGLFFQGTSAANGGLGTPFGDGLLCVGGDLRRLELALADPSGVSATSLDLAAAGAIGPGQTRRYQLWYRDSLASPCGNGFNLTNGIEVVWWP